MTITKTIVHTFEPKTPYFVQFLLDLRELDRGYENNQTPSEVRVSRTTWDILRMEAASPGRRLVPFEFLTDAMMIGGVRVVRGDK